MKTGLSGMNMMISTPLCDLGNPARHPQRVDAITANIGALYGE